MGKLFSNAAALPIVCALLLVAVPSLGETAPWLSWNPPPECPGKEHIEQRVTEWLGGALPPDRGLRVRAHVDWKQQRWEVIVHVEQHGVRGERRVQVDRCADAADFVALTVVLAVEPDSAIAAEGSFSQEEEGRRTTPEPHEQSPQTSQAVTETTPDEVPATVATQQKWALWGAVGGEVSSGALPQPQVGGAAHLGLHQAAWLVSLGARFLPATGFEVPEAIAPIQFSLLTARAGACYLTGEGPWLLGPCASAEWGAILTRQRIDSTSARTVSIQTAENWIQLALGGRGEVRMASFLSTYAQFELGYPLLRHRFRLDDDTLIHQPSWGGRAELGLRFFSPLK